MPRVQSMVVGIMLLAVVALIVGCGGGSNPWPIGIMPSPERIAFSSRRDGNWEIYLMNADGSAQTNLTKNPEQGMNYCADDCDPAWSPDGQKIAFASIRGTWPHANSEIYAMNADGSGQTRLTDNPAEDSYPAWSPEGSRIAFARRPLSPFTYDIWGMNADGTGETRLTNDPMDDNMQPAWSPDGTKIAFVSSRDGNSEIYVMNADGTQKTRLTNNLVEDWHPAWSRDGSKIAFARRCSDWPNPNFEIYLMNADGSGQSNLTNNSAFDDRPAWSPDGTKIAFDSSRDNVNQQIYIMNANGTGVRKLTDNPFTDLGPTWWGPKP